MKRKSKPSGQLWRIDLSAAGVKIRVGNNDPQLMPGQVTSMTRMQPNLLVLGRHNLPAIQIDLMTGSVVEARNLREALKKLQAVAADSQTLAS